MRAIQFSEFGEPANVLSLREIDPPQPASGEVTVRMIASPINPSDLMTVRGIYGNLPELPATPGYEGVGIVESGGGLMGRFLKGKRVAVLNRGTGNWKERVVIPAKQAIPLPDSLSTDQAAMFFVNPATAYVMTREVLGVPDGGWLLQTAAASALGRMVIRLGKHLGFRTANVVRRESHIESLRNEGADEVIVFDGESEDREQLAERLREQIGEDISHAIDPVGGKTLGAVIESLAVGGRVLSYGTLAGGDTAFSPRKFLMQTAHVQGFWLTRYMNDLGLLGKLSLVRKVSKLIEAGVLGSTAEFHFPLEEIGEAVRKSEEPGRGGKVVLTIGE